MEKLPLRAQPLHNVHAFLTKEANVAAANVDGELFSEGALWKESAQSIFRGQRGDMGMERRGLNTSKI